MSFDPFHFHPTSESESKLTSNINISPGKFSDSSAGGSRSASASAAWIPTGNGGDPNVTFATKASTPNTDDASTPDIGVSA